MEAAATGRGEKKAKMFFGGRPQLGLDDRGDLVGSERRHVILEPGQGRLEQLAVRRGDHAVGVDEGEDLAHFHDRPLHVAQDLGVTFGEPLLAGPLRGLGCPPPRRPCTRVWALAGHGVPGQPGQANGAPDPSGGQLGLGHDRYSRAWPRSGSVQGGSLPAIDGRVAAGRGSI